MPEPAVTERLEQAVTDGAIAIDIGANPKGTDHVSTMAENTGRDGRVIAFDPFPIPALYDLEDEYPHVLVVSEAVTDEPVHIQETQAVVGQSVPEYDREYHGGVPLDVVAAADIVKIDVEGHEERVLRSGTRVIERSHPVFIIETHPEKAGSESLRAMIDVLHAHEYEVMSIQHDDYYENSVQYTPRQEHIVCL